MAETRPSVETREQRAKIALATTAGTASAKTVERAGRDKLARQAGHSISLTDLAISRIARLVRRRTRNKGRCRAANKHRGESISKARSRDPAEMTRGIASLRRAAAVHGNSSR